MREICMSGSVGAPGGQPPGATDCPYRPRSPDDQDGPPGSGRPLVEHVTIHLAVGTRLATLPQPRARRPHGAYAPKAAAPEFDVWKSAAAGSKNCGSRSTLPVTQVAPLGMVPWTTLSMIS